MTTTTITIDGLTKSEAIAFRAIAIELKAAKKKHPNFVKTIPEMALVITEETGELCQAVLKNAYEGGDYWRVNEELVQVGAMSVRMLSEIS